jgi:PAS domain S-box-containing protein
MSQPTEGKTIEVLLVEDNEGDVRIVQEVLRDAPEIRIHTVARLSLAVAHLASQRTDVVLLDLGLPDSQGLDSLRAICDVVPQVPVIVLTGQDDEVIGETAIRQGAQDYLIKPVMPGRLLPRVLRFAFERKRALEALERETEFSERIIDSMRDGFSILDSQGIHLKVNAALCRMTGFSREELIGVGPPHPYWPPEEIDKIQAAFQKTLQGHIGDFELIFRRKNGERFPAIVSPSWIDDEHGKVISYFANVKDITERKLAEEERFRLEQQLQQVRKAESLGRMAGAIAHHFNNILGVVMGNLELAMFELPQGSKPRVNVAEAMAASGRAAEISGLMLAYLGQSIGVRAPVDLSGACREALALLSASLPITVHVRTDFPDGGPIIRADAAQIRQILTNLVLNAVEALGDREGEVVVAVRVMPTADFRAFRFCPPEWVPKVEYYACLSVSDNGSGIDGGILEKIFDPFFSTRIIGRGLGLPVVLGVVKAHEGGVTVESVPGRGAVFRVFLPLSAEQSRQPLKAEPAASESPGTGDLVLVVEDEVMMRDVVETMLKMLGYEVLTAADGVEALEVFRDHRDGIRCVLLDLSMPRMDGWETLTALRSLRADLPIILASGYDEAQVMAGDHLERPQVFLHKPYRMAQLQAALEAVRMIR